MSRLTPYLAATPSSNALYQALPSPVTRSQRATALRQRQAPVRHDQVRIELSRRAQPGTDRTRAVR